MTQIRLDDAGKKWGSEGIASLYDSSQSSNNYERLNDEGKIMFN